MFTMFRRAVFGAAIAALTAAVLRIFGGDGAPPQRGGWREVDARKFDQLEFDQLELDPRELDQRELDAD